MADSGHITSLAIPLSMPAYIILYASYLMDVLPHFLVLLITFFLVRTRLHDFSVSVHRKTVPRQIYSIVHCFSKRL